MVSLQNVNILGLLNFKYFLGIIDITDFLVNSICGVQAYVSRKNGSTPPPLPGNPPILIHQPFIFVSFMFFCLTFLRI